MRRGSRQVSTHAQALFFVALFMRSSREAVLGWAERVLPASIPGLRLSRPPAEELHAFINKSISKFQVRHGLGSAMCVCFTFLWR